jgi:hypothetical protein
VDSARLRQHGKQVNDFARKAPNMGRLGDLTSATLEMLKSQNWRDYSDATGVYHFLPSEFDYFLALQTIEARDVARLYLTKDDRVALAAAMDHQAASSRRRSLDVLLKAHPHAAQSLTTYWERYGWAQTYPMGHRATIRARYNKTREARTERRRINRLGRTSTEWRTRVNRVVVAAKGLSDDELRIAIARLTHLLSTHRRNGAANHR